MTSFHNLIDDHALRCNQSFDTESCTFIFDSSSHLVVHPFTILRLTRISIRPTAHLRKMSTATGTPASPIADVSSSSDSRDQTLVIRQVTPDIITFSIPFTRSGMVPIGGRGTAIKLPSSEIMLYVSTPHTPATAETIAKFGGEVKWLVTPDGEHDMYIQEYAQAYPNAQ